MKRRILLAGISSSTVTITGCLSDNDGWGYNAQCELPDMNYEYLPENAKEEVDIAFEDGEYQTSDTLYYELLLERPEEQALWKYNTYYVADITREESTTTLRFEETIPTLDEFYSSNLEIENRTEEEFEVEITIIYGEGEILRDENGESIEERELKLDTAQNRSHSMPVLDKYTTYVLQIIFENGRSEIVRFENNRKKKGAIVSIYEDEVSVGMENGGWATCPWEPEMG